MRFHLVSNKAPIDAAHVGAFPKRAANGAIIKKYHGYDGDDSSRTASNTILTSESVVPTVLIEAT